MKHKPTNVFELKELIRNEKINLGDIDTSNVGSFGLLFQNSTRKDFSGIETWDTSNVTYMVGTFSGAKHFNQDISSWDVSNVFEMSNMFLDADSFNQVVKWLGCS